MARFDLARALAAGSGSLANYYAAQMRRQQDEQDWQKRRKQTLADRLAMLKEGVRIRSEAEDERLDEPLGASGVLGMILNAGGLRTQRDLQTARDVAYPLQVARQFAPKLGDPLDYNVNGIPATRKEAIQYGDRGGSKAPPKPTRGQIKDAQSLLGETRIYKDSGAQFEPGAVLTPGVADLGASEISMSDYAKSAVADTLGVDPARPSLLAAQQALGDVSRAYPDVAMVNPEVMESIDLEGWNRGKGEFINDMGAFDTHVRVDEAARRLRKLVKESGNEGVAIQMIFNTLKSEPYKMTNDEIARVLPEINERAAEQASMEPPEGWLNTVTESFGEPEDTRIAPDGVWEYRRSDIDGGEWQRL